MPDVTTDVSTPSTPPKLIFLVVTAIAILAFMGVGTLCASFFLHSYADPAILTAIITLTSGLTGSLVTILSSPRTHQPDAINGKSPQKVEVANPPEHPIPTTEVNP